MPIFSKDLLEMPEYKPPTDPAVEPTPSALVADFQQESRNMQLGLSLQQTSGVNPDEHAEAIKISQKVGLPADSIRQDLPAYREQTRQDELRSRIVSLDNPKLAKAFTDPDFSKVAADDVDVLREIENIYKSQWEGLQQGAAVNQLGRLGSKESFGQLDDEQKKRSLELQERMKNVKEYDGIAYAANTTAEIVGQMGDAFGKLLKDSVTSGGALGALYRGAQDGFKVSAQDVASASVGSSYLRDIFDIESGHFFLDVKDITDANGNKIDPDLVKAGAMTVGLINASLEAIGLGFIGKPIIAGTRRLISDTTQEVLKKASTSTAVKSFLKAYSTAWIGETGTEVVQENVNIGVEAAIKGLSDGDFKQISMDELTAANVEIFKKVGTGMAFLSLPGAAVNFAADIDRVQTANRNQEVMESLGDNVKASKLRERASDKFGAYIDYVMKDGPVENAIISAEKFDEYFQTAEIDMVDLMERLPSVAEQIEEARTVGGDILIPINEYAKVLAPTEHHNALMQDIHFSATDITPREAAEMQAKLPEMLASYIEAEQAKIDQVNTVEEKINVIVDGIKSQLNKTGESPLISDRYAQVVARGLSGLTERWGLDLEAEFRKIGLEIKAPVPERLKKTEDLDLLIDRVRFSKAPAQQELYGKSLLEMLSERGGVLDEGGELSARDAQKWHIGRGKKKFVTEDGLSLDGAREIAIGEGYLPEDATYDDLLALVTTEMSGEPVYAEQNINRQAADIQAQNRELIDYLDQQGIDFAKATNQEIKDAINGVQAEAQPAEQIFTGKTKLGGDQYGASVGRLSVGDRRQLMVDSSGGYYWGDYKEASTREGETVTTGKDKDGNVALFATSKEARQAASSIQQEVGIVEYNQQGELITDSEAFKNWFKKSAVSNEGGQPRIMYHGTGKDIEQFKGMVWGAESVDLATDYAMLRGHLAGGGDNIIPLYMSIQNPFDADLGVSKTTTVGEFFNAALGQAKDSGVTLSDDQSSQAKELLKTIRSAAKEEESGPHYDRHQFWNNSHSYFGTEGAQAIEELFKLLGFDGVKMVEGGADTFGAFSPLQVKSTMNRGTFSLTDPRIHYQTDQITVKVKAIEAETGREMTIDQNADEALQEANDSIDTLESLLECLSS